MFTVKRDNDILYKKIDFEMYSESRNVLYEYECKQAVSYYDDLVEAFTAEYDIQITEELGDQKYSSSMIDDRSFRNWYDILDETD